MTRIAIRDPMPADELRWRELWEEYYRFYETAVPEEVIAATWRRMLDPASSIHGRLAEADGEVAGFSICVLHEGTWTLGPVCYLEDLFVDPARRGGGIGHALIHDLLSLGRMRGWSRLYWHTRAGNAAARRLYDRFGAADDFVRYRIMLE